MKVLFDSNVIIDAVTNREDSNVGAKELYLKAAVKEIDGYLVAKQISDIAYVLRKYIDKEKIKSFIMFLCKAFIILPFEVKDIEGALEINGHDFEDDILVFIAKEYKLDIIATNNIKDFNTDIVSVLKPDELMRI